MIHLSLGEQEHQNFIINYNFFVFQKEIIELKPQLACSTTKQLCYLFSFKIEVHRHLQLLLFFYVGSLAFFYQAWDFVLHKLINSISKQCLGEPVSFNVTFTCRSSFMDGRNMDNSISKQCLREPVSSNVTFICMSSSKDGRNMDNSISKHCLGESVNFNVTFTSRSSFMDQRNMEGTYYFFLQGTLKFAYHDFFPLKVQCCLFFGGLQIFSDGHLQFLGVHRWMPY